MEGLAPTLQLCIETRIALENGEAVSYALNRIMLKLERELRYEVQDLLLAYEQSGSGHVKNISKKSPCRQVLLTLLSAGLVGEPILERLKELESEIRLACEMEIDGHVAGLPLKVMVPILLLQFPAFMLLLFGPLLNQLTKELLR